MDDGLAASSPLQSSFEEFLDLEAFACEERVIVQYAAVNSRGQSDWSPNTFVSVYGVQGSGMNVHYPIHNYVYICVCVHVL